MKTELKLVEEQEGLIASDSISAAVSQFAWVTFFEGLTTINSRFVQCTQGCWCEGKGGKYLLPQLPSIHNPVLFVTNMSQCLCITQWIQTLLKKVVSSKSLFQMLCLEVSSCAYWECVWSAILLIYVVLVCGIGTAHICSFSTCYTKIRALHSMYWSWKSI